MSAEAQVQPAVDHAAQPAADRAVQPAVQPADRAVQPVVEHWMSEHLPRPARVRYPDDWAWPGQPHPACRKAEIRVPPDGDAGAPADAWVVIRPALAHDGHLLATGASCPGAPGLLPATPRRVHEDRLVGAIGELAHARARLLAAQRDVVHLEREVARARALVEVARGLEQPGR